MTSQELHSRIKTSLFTRNDVAKLFSNESSSQINTQLFRMTGRGELIGIKRGLFLFSDAKIDEFVISNKLYFPSYVSLESVLNISGVIPDVASAVTGVTTVTSKIFNTPVGSFTYSKISKNLFFGYGCVLDEQSGQFYNIASPEKALLDYIYIRRVRDLTELRVDTSGLDKSVLLNYSHHFPKWVRKVLENE